MTREGRKRTTTGQANPVSPLAAKPSVRSITPVTFKLSTFCNPLLAACTAGILFAASTPSWAGQRIKVYDIPKESAADSHATEAADPHGSTSPATPQLKWASLPDGWKENPNPGQMRVASFLVSGGEGNEAEVAVVPMGVKPEIELQILNMWRGQVQLSPLTDADMASQFSEIPVGDATGRLFELASTEPVLGGKNKARILVAMLRKTDTTWFFKFAGEDSLVAGRRASFLEFLKGVSFEAPAANQLPPGHPPMTGDAPGGGMGMGQGMMGVGGGGDSVKAGTGPHPDWEIPAGWSELDHSPFLVAKFRVTGEGGAQADINVSSSGGMGGGLLPNVNRWRGQLSLGAIDQAALDKLATTLDLPAGKAIVVDFSGADSENDAKNRCVGVMVTVQNSTWFYKLAGSETVVAREKEALLKFVRSVKY